MASETNLCAEAIRQIEETPAVKYAGVLVVSGAGWHPGVIGIVAARLVSKYGKPAVVITTDGETGKGSCRSIPGFSVYDALAKCAPLLTHFGGHPGAAGLGVLTENIPALRDALDAYTKTGSMPFAQIGLDFKLNPAYINVSLLNTLAALEPCGCENPVPTFGLYNMTLRAVNPVGEGKHLRLTLQKGASEIAAMLFSVTLAEFPYRIGDAVDLAVQMDIVQKSGSWFSMGDERIGQGANSVKEYLINNPDIAAQVEAQVRENLWKLNASAPKAPAQAADKAVAVSADDFSDED